MAIEPSANASMDCSDLERAVDAYLDGEFDGRERAEAEAHLASCQRCRALADAQARIRSAVRARLREAMSPPAEERPGPARAPRPHRGCARAPPSPALAPALLPVPLGALAACAAGAVLVVATHGADDALVVEAVRSHHRGLPLEVMAASVGEGSIPALVRREARLPPRPAAVPGRRRPPARRAPLAPRRAARRLHPVRAAARPGGAVHRGRSGRPLRSAAGTRCGSESRSCGS